MAARVEQAFEQCWSALLEGETLDSCLSRFPDLGAELHPLLEAALDAHDLWDIPVPEERAFRSRRRMALKASELRPRKVSKPQAFALSRPLLVGFAMIVIVFFAGSGLVVASAASLPGESLYPVKLAVERVQISLALNTASQLSLASSFEQRRIDEVRRLLALGRAAKVQFDGRLDSVSADLLTVEGVPVTVSPATSLSPDLRPGDHVTVAGDTNPAGWVLAASVRLTGQQFIGVVDSMGPAAWRISGRTVRVAPDTIIDDGIRLSDQVSVQLKTEAGFTVAASIHLVQHNQDGPAATEIQGDTQGTASPPAPIGTPSVEIEQETSIPQPGTPEILTISGTVSSMTQTVWIVSGQTVAINSETDIDSSIGAGDTVEVRGTLDVDGVIRAQRIRLLRSAGSEDDQHQEFEFTGIVESIAPSQWEIAGRTVEVDSRTDIEGSPHVGDRVQVQVVTNADGSLRAVQIQRQDSGSDGEGSGDPSHDD